MDKILKEKTEQWMTLERKTLEQRKKAEQFYEEPVLKINSVQEVTAADIQYYGYEGRPFSSPEERKKVKVVSPGWIYMDKQVQISRPRVQEEE